MRVSQFLGVAAGMALVVQGITLFYVLKTPEKEERPYIRFVNAAVLPYFSIIVPCGITYWQHKKVFAEEKSAEEEDADTPRHESVISARGTLQEMEYDEPDLSAEFDLSVIPADKNKHEQTRDIRPSNMLVKRLI